MTSGEKNPPGPSHGHWEKGSSIIYNQLWCDKNIDSGEKVIIATMLTFQNYDNPNRKFSQNYLSSITGMCSKTIGRKLKTLVEKEYIYIISKYCPVTNKSQCYALAFELMWSRVPKKQKQQDAQIREGETKCLDPLPTKCPDPSGQNVQSPPDKMSTNRNKGNKRNNNTLSNTNLVSKKDPAPAPSQAEEREKPIFKFNFKALQQLYPKIEGDRGLKECAREIKTQQDYDRVERAIKNYTQQVKDEERDLRYVKSFDNFMFSWMDYESPPPVPESNMPEFKQKPSLKRILHLIRAYPTREPFRPEIEANMSELEKEFFATHSRFNLGQMEMGNLERYLKGKCSA